MVIMQHGHPAPSELAEAFDFFAGRPRLERESTVCGTLQGVDGPALSSLGHSPLRYPWAG
jgi:hypothetical protein